MRTSVRLALAGSTLLAGVAFAAPAVAAPYPLPPTSSGSMSATQVDAGQSVVFAAAGFAPKSKVTITVEGGRTYKVRANKAGEVALRLTFGDAGTYEVTASGVGPDGAARSVSASVVVVAASTTSTVPTSSDVSSSSLPFTGMEVGAVAALGAATLIGGATVRVVARRRNVEV